MCQKGCCGRMLGYLSRASREGVAGDGYVVVGGAAAFGGDDVCVVLGPDFVDDADEAVGPAVFVVGRLLSIVALGRLEGKEWRFFAELRRCVESWRCERCGRGGR